MLEDYKIRIISNACITRYDRGEKDLLLIVGNYKLSDVDEKLVLNRIYELRPELKSV